MQELLREVLTALAVISAILVWIPCGIIGIIWAVKWLIRERRCWKNAAEDADDGEYADEEGTVYI